MSDLPFTGERFTPECVREMWYEHHHRYAFARAISKDKQVADVACGEGYGAALLAASAKTVIGVDISAEAIAHARSRYAGIPTLTFEVGDATNLVLPDRSIDVITSFETLEHLHAQDALVAGFARVLTDDGVLLISSPDKRTYSDLPGYQNEFHVRELYRAELLELLGRHFGAVRLYGQKLLFQSAIWRADAATTSAAMHTSGADGVLSDKFDYDPIYFIAVCAHSQAHLPSLPDLDLFGDADESVYRHYEHEIRKNIQAGGLLQQYQDDLASERAAHVATVARLSEAEDRLRAFEHQPTARPWWRRWLKKT